MVSGRPAREAIGVADRSRPGAEQMVEPLGHVATCTMRVLTSLFPRGARGETALQRQLPRARPPVPSHTKSRMPSSPTWPPHPLRHCPNAGARPRGRAQGVQRLVGIAMTSWKTQPVHRLSVIGTKAQCGPVVQHAPGLVGFPWGLLVTPMQIARNISALTRRPDPLRPRPSCCGRRGSTSPRKRCPGRSQSCGCRFRAPPGDYLVSRATIDPEEEPCGTCASDLRRREEWEGLSQKEQEAGMAEYGAFTGP